MKPTRSVEIYKYMDFEKHMTVDEIIVEYELLLIVNGHELIKFICTPWDLEELAIGYLHSENIVKDYDSISGISFEEIDENRGRISVDINDGERYLYTETGLNCIKTITPACGNNRTYNLPIINAHRTLERKSKVDLEKISEIMKDFNEKSELFSTTGGVHSCALASSDEILKFAEDIGRHNALDKVVGMIIKEKIELEDRVLLTSGRISSEIVHKALSARASVLVSRSAPTSKALILGEQYNMTIIGFARGNRMNVYTGFEFIK
jgi:FdhD protein